MPIPVSELVESAATLKQAARCVDAMRQAVGDGIDIMLDLHARTTPAAAIQFGRMLVDYNLYWYEEPCWPEHVDALVEVARALPFPIATGERLVGRCGIPRVARKAGAAPSCNRMSATAAESARRGASPPWRRPTRCPWPATIRRVPSARRPRSHVGFATPNYLIQEVVRDRRALAQRYSRRTHAIWRAAFASAPAAPGLGIEINEKEAAKHPFEPEVTMAYFHRDGSVADW